MLPTFDDADIGRRPVDNGWDLAAARGRWTDVGLMASYIAKQRRLEGEQGAVDDGNTQPVDIETLAMEQRKVFDRFVETYEQIVNGVEDQPVIIDASQR